MSTVLVRTSEGNRWHTQIRMFSVGTHYRTLGRMKGSRKEQGRSAGLTHQVCGCPKFTGTKGKVALPETEGESLVIEDCLKRSRDFREHR